MAVDIFKSMKSCGFLPDAATYNIMIDCCSVVRCFKSASALVSLMLRDGFYPQAVTYTALIKVFFIFPTTWVLTLSASHKNGAVICI